MMKSDDVQTHRAASRFIPPEGGADAQLRLLPSPSSEEMSAYYLVHHSSFKRPHEQQFRAG
jgi:hypothetical protein